MTTKCYFVEYSFDAERAANAASLFIPCLYSAYREDDYLVITFTVYDKDIAFIENCLAPFV